MKERRKEAIIYKPKQRLKVGDSGLLVSPVCLGLTQSPDMACTAFDMGFNFFFLSADMHWPVYKMARKSLAKLLDRGKLIREKIVVAAVSYPTQPELSRAPFLELLEAIEKLKKIDILTIGASYSSDFMGRLKIYTDLKRQNFVGAKAIGTTFHERTTAILPINHELIDIGFIRYNTSHPGARRDVFPFIKDKRKSLLFGFKSTSGWFSRTQFSKLGLSDEYVEPEITDHYRFVLYNKSVDGILCAPQSIRELQMLVKSMEKGPLDEEEERYMMGLSQLYDGKVQLKVNPSNT